MRGEPGNEAITYAASQLDYSHIHKRTCQLSSWLNTQDSFMVGKIHQPLKVPKVSSSYKQYPHSQTLRHGQLRVWINSCKLDFVNPTEGYCMSEWQSSLLLEALHPAHHPPTVCHRACGTTGRQTHGTTRWDSHCAALLKWNWSLQGLQGLAAKMEALRCLRHRSEWSSHFPLGSEIECLNLFSMRCWCDRSK